MFEMKADCAHCEEKECYEGKNCHRLATEARKRYSPMGIALSANSPAMMEMTRSFEALRRIL